MSLPPTMDASSVVPASSIPYHPPMSKTAPSNKVVAEFTAGDVLRVRREASEMERQMRRNFIFTSIQHAATAPSRNNNNNNNDNDNISPLHKLWRKLSHAERDDDEIVYKFLADCGCASSSLFGNDPWHGAAHRVPPPTAAQRRVEQQQLEHERRVEQQRLEREQRANRRDLQRQQQHPLGDGPHVINLLLPIQQQQQQQRHRRIHPTTSHAGLLPQKYDADPLAVLAFVSNTTVESLSWYFEVPPCMRDDKRVMMAVVAKCPRAFYQASQRLRDDDDLVRIALLKNVTRDRNIAIISPRLAKDQNLLLYAVTMGYCTLSFAQSWLENLGDNLTGLDIKQQKQVGRHMLRCMNEHVSSNNNTPPGTIDELSVAFLSRFSEELRDDKDFMLPFINRHWSALQWCSDRLCSDMKVFQVALAQDVNAYQYAKGEIRQDYMQQRDIAIVLDQIMNRGLIYDNVPTNLQTNKVILAAVLKQATGQTRLPLYLPNALKSDKMFLLDVLAAHSGGTSQFHHGVKWLYDEMTPQLRVDDYIVRALLKAGCPVPEVEKILASLPRLTAVREAMLAVVVTCRYTDVIKWQSFAFRDDHDFMLQVYMADSTNFVLASPRLRSNVDFVMAVLAWNRVVADQGKSSFMINTTMEFQLENPTLVVGAIECAERNNMQWVSNLNPGVWHNKEVILACLDKEWSVLDRVASLSTPLFGPQNPHLDDREIVSRAVAFRPAHLELASNRLRDDRAFILSLVKETDRVLHFASARMRRDKEILITAMARSGGTISDCFDIFEFGTDFEFLCNFASELRSTVEYYDSFTNLFCGMTDPTCRLSLLNQGAETSNALKEKIAEYAGVHHPIQPYKDALAKLQSFGF